MAKISEAELDADLGLSSPKSKSGMMSEAELDADLGMTIDVPISKKKSKHSKVDALLEGASQGLTMGYANNLRAASEKPITGLMNTITKSKAVADLLGVPQDPQVEPDDYIESRDKFNKETESIRKENPKTFGVGQVGGSIVSTMALPTANVLKAPTIVGRMAKNAALGGTMGAVVNPGDVEGDAGDLQIADRLKNAGLGFLIGGLASGASEASVKGYHAVKELLKRNPKATAEEIQAAAKALGIEATPGMVQGKGVVPSLESSLEQSPTLFGRLVAKDKNKVFKGLNEAASDVVSEGSGATPFQLGEEVKKGITAKVAERKEPLSVMFQEVADQTKGMQIPEKYIGQYSKTISEIPGFKMVPKAQQYVDLFQNAKTTDDLKTIMTYLNEDIRNTRGMEKIILGQVKDKLSGLETRNTLLASKNATDPELGNKIVDTLKGARKGWSEMMTDLSDVAQKTRLPKPKGPVDFLDDLEVLASERVPEKLFNPNNKAGLDVVKKNFPEQFEAMRRGKIADIAENAQFKGELSPSRLVRESNKINPEGISEIFGEKVSKLNNMKTVLDAVPENINPSGTSINTDYQGMLNPMMNLRDAGRFGAYKFLSSGMADKLSETMKNTNPTLLEKASENITPFTAASLQGRVKNDKQADERLRGKLPDIMSMVEKDPSLLQRINNQKLREVIQKGIERKKKLPQEAIQRDFIENN